MSKEDEDDEAEKYETLDEASGTDSFPGNDTAANVELKSKGQIWNRFKNPSQAKKDRKAIVFSWVFQATYCYSQRLISISFIVYLLLGVVLKYSY